MTENLARWADSKTKKAILEIVAQVTADGSPSYVPPIELHLTI